VVVNYAKSKEAASDLVARLQHSKRSESLLQCKLGDLAELLKGEVMAKDCPCCQEVAGRRRKSGQATLDHLTHIRGKHAVRMKASMFSLARWLCCVCMREFANDLVGVLRREGTQFQARER
jgi:hypothetical protein